MILKKSILLGLFLTLLSLLLHIEKSFNSMINFKTDSYNLENYFFSNNYMIATVDYHINHPVFSRRPLTSFSTKFICDNSPLNLSQSFTLLNFLLIFIGGLLVFYIAKLFHLSFIESLLSQLIYHLSFTIFLPFFRTTYTYDEPFQYLFCFIAIIAIKQKQNILLVTSLFLALIARENSLFIFPSLFILLYSDKLRSIQLNLKLFKQLLLFIIPVLLYISFYIYHLSTFESKIGNYNEMNVRVSQLFYNFQNIKYSIESISLFIMIFGIPMSLILGRSKLQNDFSTNNILIPFWTAFIINTLIVCLSARINESRVLTLPLILLFPLLGRYCQTFLKESKMLFCKNNIYLLIPSFFLIFLIDYYITIIVYRQTGAEGDENLFNEYYFATFFLTSFITINRILLHYRFKSSKHKIR